MHDFARAHFFCTFHVAERVIRGLGNRAPSCILGIHFILRRQDADSQLPATQPQDDNLYTATDAQCFSNAATDNSHNESDLNWVTGEGGFWFVK